MTADHTDEPDMGDLLHLHVLADDRRERVTDAADIDPVYAENLKTLVARVLLRVGRRAVVACLARDGGWYDGWMRRLAACYVHAESGEVADTFEIAEDEFAERAGTYRE